MRISVKAKVTSLLKAHEELIESMKHNDRLHSYMKKFKFLMVLTENIDLLRDVSFKISIVINLCILIDFKYEDGNVIYDSNFIIFIQRNQKCNHYDGNYCCWAIEHYCELLSC